MDNIYNLLTSAQGGQNQEQPTQDPNASFGFFGQQYLAPTPSAPPETAKGVDSGVKDLLALLKSSQEPSSLQKAEFDKRNTPDAQLVEGAKAQLRQFLDSIFDKDFKATPEGGVDVYSPQAIAEAQNAQKSIDTLTKSIDDQINLIKSPNQMGGYTVPKSQENYYNTLQSERNLLNTIKTQYGKLSPKSPTLPHSVGQYVQYALNQFKPYSETQGENAQNPYGYGNKEITNAILTKLGMNQDPRIKSMDNMQSIVRHIDSFMQPYLASAMGSIEQGGGIGEVNQRLALHGPNPQKALKGMMEQAAGKALASYVNNTMSMDKDTREMIWNMFPYWAATKGLDWGTIKNYGVQHAEDLARGSKDLMGPTQGTESIKPESISTPKPPKKESTTGTQDRSRLDRATSRVNDLVTGVTRGAQDVVGAGFAPFTSLYDFATNPKQPSFIESWKENMPTDITNLTQQGLNFLSPEPSTQDWAAGAKNARKNSPNIETRVSGYEGESLPNYEYENQSPTNP